MSDDSTIQKYGEDWSVEDWQNYYDYCRRNNVCACNPNHPCRQCETAMVLASLEGADLIKHR